MNQEAAIALIEALKKSRSAHQVYEQKVVREIRRNFAGSRSGQDMSSVLFELQKFCRHPRHQCHYEKKVYEQIVTTCSDCNKELTRHDRFPVA